MNRAVRIKGDSVSSESRDVDSIALAEGLDKITREINNGKTVKGDDMRAFYAKLQACRWNTPLCRMGDVSELIQFILCHDVARGLFSNDPLRLSLYSLHGDVSRTMQELLDNFLSDSNNRGPLVLSELLMLDVKRNLTGEKNKTKIKDPLTITIIANEVHTYKLVAFARHLGNNINSGHYVAYVEKDGQWFECSDTEIKCKDINAVIGSAADSNTYLYKPVEL